MRGTTFVILCCILQYVAADNNLIEDIKKEINVINSAKASAVKTSDVFGVNEWGQKTEEITKTLKFNGTNKHTADKQMIKIITIQMDEYGDATIVEKEIHVLNPNEPGVGTSSFSSSSSLFQPESAAATTVAAAGIAVGSNAQQPGYTPRLSGLRGYGLGSDAISAQTAAVTADGVDAGYGRDGNSLDGFRHGSLAKSGSATLLTTGARVSGSGDKYSFVGTFPSSSAVSAAGAKTDNYDSRGYRPGRANGTATLALIAGTGPDGTGEIYSPGGFGPGNYRPGTFRPDGYRQGGATGLDAVIIATGAGPVGTGYGLASSGSYELNRPRGVVGSAANTSIVTGASGQASRPDGYGTDTSLSSAVSVTSSISGSSTKAMNVQDSRTDSSSLSAAVARLGNSAVSTSTKSGGMNLIVTDDFVSNVQVTTDAARLEASAVVAASGYSDRIGGYGPSQRSGPEAPTASVLVAKTASRKKQRPTEIIILTDGGKKSTSTSSSAVSVTSYGDSHTADESSKDNFGIGGPSGAAATAASVAPGCQGSGGLGSKGVRASKNCRLTRRQLYVKIGTRRHPCINKCMI